MSHSSSICLFFFFNDTATTEIYTLSLHDALPIFLKLDELVNLFGELLVNRSVLEERLQRLMRLVADTGVRSARLLDRSEEHTSELQSRLHLVCRLLLEKKQQTFSLTSRDVSVYTS